jgi:predicted amidohydrolase
MSDKRKLNISVIQLDSILADTDKNLDKHYHYIEKAIADNNEIIVFPELSLSGYSLKDAVFDVAFSNDDARLKKILSYSKHISIILGCVEINERYEFFNSLFYFEDEKLLSRHRKVYLPTYGMFEEKRYFSAGNHFRAFDSKYGRFGLLICEDMWHPSSAAILAQDGASLIFVGAAGIARGFDEKMKPHNIRVWETLNRAQAVANTSFVIFANRVGVEDGLLFWGGSEIIDPSGRRIFKAPYFKEDRLIAELDLLKLKHARINTTLLSDEKLDLVIDEYTRINKKRKEY